MASTGYVSICLFFAVVLSVVGGTVPNVEQENSQSSDNLKGSRVSESLKFIVVVSRHGNRGLQDYPLDPYPINNQHYWPYGEDELTPGGRSELYKLGREIRSLYNGFIDLTFYPQEMHASSIDLDKTLMSGEAFLAGLYPPRDFQIWDVISWQPTPLHADSLDKTAVINDCPKYIEEMKSVYANFLKEYDEEITEMITYFNFVTGLNATGLEAAKYLYHLGDKLSTEELEGFKVPEWTRMLYPEPLMDFVGKMYLNMYAGTFEVTRLLIGSFFGELMDSMQMKINGSLSEKHRIHYYSGHDSSIVALQSVLGVPSSSVIGLVKPGSALVLELHQDIYSKEYYVQALIIQPSMFDWHMTYLDLPQCGTPCDFYTLFDNTRNYTDVDYEQECQATSL